MSTWSSLIASNGILDRLNALGPAIDRGLARDDNSTDDVESLARIKTVLTFIGKRLDGADGDLLLASGLQNLSSVIEEATEQCQAFANSGIPEHLVNANTAIDNALNALALLVLPTKANDLRGLREAAESYRAAMVAQVRSYEGQIAEAREGVENVKVKANELSTRLDGEKERLDAAIDAVQANLTALESTVHERQDDLESQLNSQAAAQVEALKTTFDEAQAERASEHATQLESDKNSAQKLRDEYDSKLSTLQDHYEARLKKQDEDQEAAHTRLRTDYEQKASELLVQMETNLLRAKKVMGDIGDHGIVGGFKSAADEARIQVLVWQGTTLASMLFLIGVGLRTAFHSAEHELTWVTLASRLFLSIATGILAAYAASQANRYQQRERRNRKLELELHALGPFLEPVDPTEREKFRLKIAEVFFGKDDGVNDGPGPANTAQLSKEGVEKLLELVNTIASKLPGKSS